MAFSIDFGYSFSAIIIKVPKRRKEKPSQMSDQENEYNPRFVAKLLDDDTQLIVKHFVDGDGALKLNDPQVQAALFSIPSVHDALLAAATARETACQQEKNS